MSSQQFTDDDPLLTVRQIVRDKNAKPPNSGLLPVGRSKFLKLVRAGEIPPPIKLGARGRFWRRSTIEKIRQSGGVE